MDWKIDTIFNIKSGHILCVNEKNATNRFPTNNIHLFRFERVDRVETYDPAI